MPLAVPPPTPPHLFERNTTIPPPPHHPPMLCDAPKDGVGLEGGRRAALHLDIIYIKINIYIIKGAKFEQNRIFATFSKKFHLCGKKFHLCGKTDRQTNKQTNRHNRVANTCRSANLTVASRQSIEGKGRYDLTSTPTHCYVKIKSKGRKR